MKKLLEMLGWKKLDSNENAGSPDAPELDDEVRKSGLPDAPELGDEDQDDEEQKPDLPGPGPM
jgi:hypothetical protein